MKPLYMELQAFGPFVEKQSVDFEKLSEKGIFLIKGITGSGKTTLFDAMTFVLYGGSSGDDEKSKSGRNDFEEWRCSQAPEDLVTYVYFVFRSHGRKYYFKRSLVVRRKSSSQKYEAGEIDEAGNCIPFFENPKLNDLKAKAEELLGLTKEQFRQVVLLPQGQFERFLTASSGEKEVILEKIFETDRWNDYAEQFFNTAKARKDKLDETKKAIDNSLAEENMSDIVQLSDRLLEMKQEYKELESAHIKFDPAKRRKTLDEDIALYEKFRQLHRQEQKLETLKGRKEEFEVKRVVYARAKNAESVRGPLEEYERAAKRLKEREADLAKLKEQLPEAEKAKKTAESEYAKHIEDSKVELLQKEIGTYESKRGVYESFDKLRADELRAEEEFQTAKIVFEGTDKKIAAETETAAELKKRFNAADAEARENRDRYYEGIYGDIASDLEPGKPCPVCGSTEHPAPAVKAAGSVSKSEVDSSEKKSAEAKKAWMDAEERRDKTQSAFKEIQDDFTAKKEILINAKAARTHAQENLIKGVDNLDALEAKIAELTNRIESYNSATEKLMDALSAAGERLVNLKSRTDAAETEKKTAEADCSDADKTLTDAIKDKGFASATEAAAALMSKEQLDALLKEIADYESNVKTAAADLEAAREGLKDRAEPDSDKFEQRQSEIDEENRIYTDNKARLDSESDRLGAKQADLKNRLDRYKSEINEAENDLAFAKKLRGDTGVGLHRYVIAIMFNQVISEANKMLQKVHGGRYSLFRTDDRASGKKRGLELKVHDNRSPEKEGRPVSMLSGGEKFLVSLALSIGMSSVAQKSGVQIETLFIDEGFGTLDNGSINDAMDILDSIRKGHGTIGIISHVQLLEDNIPTQLEIVKKDSGNYIQMS